MAYVIMHNDTPIAVLSPGSTEEDARIAVEVAKQNYALKHRGEQTSASYFYYRDVVWVDPKENCDMKVL
jgi:hypothetical protein